MSGGLARDGAEEEKRRRVLGNRTGSGSGTGKGSGGRSAMAGYQIGSGVAACFGGHALRRHGRTVGDRISSWGAMGAGGRRQVGGGVEGRREDGAPPGMTGAAGVFDGPSVGVDDGEN